MGIGEGVIQTHIYHAWLVSSVVIVGRILFELGLSAKQKGKNGEKNSRDDQVLVGSSKY